MYAGVGEGNGDAGAGRGGLRLISSGRAVEKESQQPEYCGQGARPATEQKVAVGVVGSELACVRQSWESGFCGPIAVEQPDSLL